MLVAGTWLTNFKKNQKRDFAFGPMSDRKTTIKHDPVYRQSSDRWGMSSENVIDYYKATLTTIPFAVNTLNTANYGHYFYVSGENIVTCKRDKFGVDEEMPCISDTGRKFMLKKNDKTRVFEKVEIPTPYQSEKINNMGLACIHKPEKCAVNDESKVRVLDNFILSLASASNVLDDLKTVISQEKERMKHADESAKQKQTSARESLKGWGKL
jgi:hypothetical protein